MFLLSLLDPSALRKHALPDGSYRKRRVGVAVCAVESMVWNYHRAEMSDSARREVRRHLATSLAPNLTAIEIDEQLEALAVDAYKAYASRMRGNHLLHLL